MLYLEICTEAHLHRNVGSSSRSAQYLLHPNRIWQLIFGKSNKIKLFACGVCFAFIAKYDANVFSLRRLRKSN